MALFSEVEASVRANTDQPDTGRTPQTLILALANEEYEEVIRRLADFFPDPYRAISSDLTVTDTATNYLDVSGLAGTMKILEVQRKERGRYFAIDPAGVNAEADPKLTWRQRGFPGSSGAAVDIFPPEASVGTYRVLYTVFPGALTASPDATLKLPLGGRKYLAACVSARVRHREEEDESYMITVRNEAFAALRNGLTPSGAVIGTRGRY